MTIVKNEQLEMLKNRAIELNVTKIAEFVLNNPKFEVWSGSSKEYQHHYGKHGLLNHTAEVINLCDLFQILNPELNEKVLFLGALFHDYGKIWDYEPLNEEYSSWGSTEHKRLIHHVSRSAVEWTFACTNCWEEWVKLENRKAQMNQENINCIDRNDSVFEAVLHVILSHHGNRVAGSPVAPKSREAWIVHYCDSISARLDDADTFDVVKNYD